MSGRKQLALNANQEEIRRFEFIKEHRYVDQDSMMLRILINQEYKKILAESISLDINCDVKNQEGKSD